MVKAKLAMYKGSGNIYDKLIRWWTESKYSHCELVVDGVWYTSSPRDGGVVKRELKMSSNWDMYDVYVDEKRLEMVMNRNEGAKYDWLGIVFTQVLPFGIHSKSRMFCSEFVAEVLGYYRPHEWSPQDVYEKVSR